MAGRIVMVDLDADPDVIAPLVEGVRIYAGYSGWTIGQLEGEIERDDWIVLSALPSDVLVGTKEDLWGRCCVGSRYRCRYWRPTRSTSAGINLLPTADCSSALRPSLLAITAHTTSCTW